MSNPKDISYWSGHAFLHLSQGSKGGKTMIDKLMYIHNDDTQNYSFLLKSLSSKLNQPTNENSIESCQSNELENVIIKLWGLV